MIARTYQDLLNEIQIYNKQILRLECQKTAILKHTWRGPVGYQTNTGVDSIGIRRSNYLYTPDESEIKIKQIDNLITDCTWMLNILQDQLKEINKLLYKLEGKQYKIFYLHKCENRTFNEISKEIGVSLRWVKKIYKEVAGNE